MPEVSKKYQDELEGFKKNVQSFQDYWRDNSLRYNEFMRFVFKSTIDQQDINFLDTIGKPPLTFNTLEPYVSRICGELIEHTPSIKVSSAPGSNSPIDKETTATIETVEGFMRHILDEANRRKFTGLIAQSTLGGGYAAALVSIDYESPMALEKVIKFEPIVDPVMCGWDIYATHPNKIDGDYAFRKFARTKESLEEDYPDLNLNTVNFNSSTSDKDMSWFYTDGQQKISVLCEFYKRKKKKKTIVKLTNGKIMFKEEYEKLQIQWNDQKIEEPARILEKRTTTIDYICRYVFIGNKILEYKETKFIDLPLIFIDGNSVPIREVFQGPLIQTTRPLVFHAKGMQRLKDLAGQTIAAYLEDSIRSKWLIAKESIPSESQFVDNLTTPQKGALIAYNAYDPNNPDRALPSPREIQLIPAPPEVMNTFTTSDSTIQTILGSYDASLGINNNQLSGVAIREGSIQSNAATKPYIGNIMQGLTAIAQTIVDILPFFYKTPRTIPTLDAEGKETFVKINEKGQPSFDFSKNPLHIIVESGPNFKSEQNRAIDQIASLSKNIPGMAEFIKDKALPIIADNINIRGSDIFKILAQEWTQEQKQMKKMSQNIPNTEMMKIQNQMKETQIKERKLQTDTIFGAAKIGLMQQQEDTEREKVILAVGSAAEDNALRKEKSDTERYHSATELAIKSATGHHHHEREMQKLAQSISHSIKP